MVLRSSLSLAPPPAVHAPAVCIMASPNIHGFLAQDRVTVNFDVSSPVSKISPSVVASLDLAAIFTVSGHLTCTTTLAIPTIDGYYSSYLDLVIGYGLSADIVLGADWALPCQPILNENGTALQRPHTQLLDSLPSPHKWYPIAGVFITYFPSHSTLTSLLAPVDLAQHIWGIDGNARDALSSLLNECCNNDVFCSDLIIGHGIHEDYDSRDAQRDAILKHLLNGMCALQSFALCQLLAHNSASTVHLSYAFRMLLLNAWHDGMINGNSFSFCCMSVGFDATTMYPQRQLVRKLEQWLKCRKDFIECEDFIVILNRLHKFRIDSLNELAHLHGMEPHFPGKAAAYSAIVSHLTKGACNHTDGKLCEVVRSTFQPASGYLTTVDLELHILKRVLQDANRKVFSCILDVFAISHSVHDSIKVFRSMLRKHCSTLRASGRVKQNSDQNSMHNVLAPIVDSWPQRIPHVEKVEIIHEFRSSTSSNALKSFTCASCAEHVRDAKRCEIPTADVNLDVLRYPASLSPSSNDHVPPMPLVDGLLNGVLVDPAGVTYQDGGSMFMTFCSPCKNAISRGKLPRFSLANLNVLGNVPPELSNLTLIEELIVARCRAKMCVVKLQDHRDDVELPTAQRGIKGHVIVFPQHPESVSKLMPPALCDIIAPICIIFCGSAKPSLEWLKEKARPLVVRREAVLKALQWLRIHNALYHDVVIDAARLSALPEEDVLNYSIEYIPLSLASRNLSSRYDVHIGSSSTDDLPQPLLDDQVQFESVVITDVEAHSPSYQLKAAALRHAKRGGSFIEVPHDPNPVNEFFNPAMFPMLYPTLFPYGIGGFEDKRRVVPIGLDNHVKHMLTLADKRFQQHYSFMFVVFNVIQRRRLLLHTSLRVNRNNFASWAWRFRCVSIEAIGSLASQASNGVQPIPDTDDERLASELMKEVKAISGNIPGSPESRLTMRNEIRANILLLGVPSFFVTINPADVYNPIVKFLAGNDIDIDNLLSDQVPTYWEQARVIAKNPCLAAEFFDIYINAFISTVLRYDPKRRSVRPGILGVTKAYYGCVEAQGRGSLHCHMVIWLHGGLTSDEIRDRIVVDHRWRDQLIEFLDDTVCNVIPADPDPSMSIQSSQHHPCAVRGINAIVNPTTEDTLKGRLKDVRNVVLQSQCHSHTATCYKNQRSGDVKRCRFNLDESNVQPKTFFNEESGSLVMRHLDGMINNYCPTISECLRCNTDIKFMASGDAAKSVLFYITDYITKTGNKSHISFGALEVALKKLGDYDPTDTDTEDRAKRMLQKCVYAVLSHQELSGQQVAAYLKGYGDHYTSHRYRNLYWLSFERSIDSDDPSPECYVKRHSNIAGNDGAVPTPEETVDNAPLNLPDGDAMGREDDSPFEDNRDDEDVAIAATRGGAIVQCSSQLHDYQFRAPALAHLSVWDFVSCVDKVTARTSREATTSMEYEEDNWGMSASGGSEDEIGQCDESDLGGQPLCPQSAQGGRSSQVFPLDPGHIQSGKKAQRARRDPSTHYVPVPVGPALPRRDSELLRAKYCRLMLILFKPWRVSADLRNVDESWADAFNTFMNGCNEATKRILNNMQVLHECKDAKDIEDSRRRDSRRTNPGSGWSDGYGTEEFAGDVDCDDLLDHLESVVNYAANRKSRMDADVIECLNAIDQCGIHDPLMVVHGADAYNRPDEIILPDDLPLEDIWKTAYEDRRNLWKRRLCTAAEAPSVAAAVHLNPTVSSIDTPSLPPITASLKPLAQLQKEPITIDAIISKWTLNVEQTRAFSIIVSHSQSGPNAEQLRMYLGGPGGTGKSRVINALRNYFTECGETRRFRLASYTGVAAKNINGTTLHTALSLNQGQKGHGRMKGKGMADLIAMWLGVDYMFVDEVSMIGCYLLLQIHRALVDAKGCTDPFGGVNVIFAGDFAQLPPVGQTKLFTRTGSTKEAIVFGQLLWRSITTVVMLTQQMRQAGAENVPFVEMLSRLRDGRCTPADYELLNTRLLSVALDHTLRPQWRSAPVIVYMNAIRDAVNVEATMAFARQTNQRVHWYHAVDTYCGHTIEDSAITDLLDSMPSNKTGGRVGALPLVLGMPVIISENLDVSGGIVNGSIGILRKVRYRINDEKRYLTSCIVEVTDGMGDELPHLPSEHVAVLSGTAEMTAFRHPKSGRSITLHRQQVPLDAGFAITAHKAQGRTMDKVIVDLNSCIGTEAVYVMVSRCTSLKGLMILRPFPIQKITTHRSQEARDEFGRLDRLNTQTRAESERGPIGNGDSLLSRQPTTSWGASAVTALFSGAESPDITSATELLGRLWNGAVGHGMLCPSPLCVTVSDIVNR
jgi:hypothetical protein